MRIDSAACLEVRCHFSTPHPLPTGELAYSLTTCSAWLPYVYSPIYIKPVLLFRFRSVMRCALPLPRYNFIIAYYLPCLVIYFSCFLQLFIYCSPRSCTLCGFLRGMPCSRFQLRVLNVCISTGLIRTYATSDFHLYLSCSGCTTSFSYHL